MELYDYLNTGFASYDAVASSMNVSFEPVEQDDGSIHYISAVDDGDGNNVYLDSAAHGNNGAELERPRLTTLSTMFVGSITILGLYMAFRMLKKTRGL